MYARGRPVALRAAMITTAWLYLATTLLAALAPMLLVTLTPVVAS